MMSYTVSSKQWRRLQGAVGAGTGLASPTDCPYRAPGEARDWMAGYVSYLCSVRSQWPRHALLFHVKHAGAPPKGRWADAEMLFLRLTAGRLPDDIVARLLGRPGAAVRLKRGRPRRLKSS